MKEQSLKALIVAVSCFDEQLAKTVYGMLEHADEEPIDSLRLCLETENETKFRILKNRMDGSVKKFLGEQTFDTTKNEYQKTFVLGELSKDKERHKGFIKGMLAAYALFNIKKEGYHESFLKNFTNFIKEHGE